MGFPRATRHCKDSNRRGSWDGPTRFDFLGYTFRPRSVRSRSGRLFVGFTPAVSDAAGKRMRREVRRWRLHLRTRTTLNDLAREINPVTRGWLNYYGQFHRSALSRTFNSIDAYLARWLTRKYKRFRNRPRRAYRFLLAVKQRQPGLFAHWRVVATPTG